MWISFPKNYLAKSQEVHEYDDKDSAISMQASSQVEPAANDGYSPWRLPHGRLHRQPGATESETFCRFFKRLLTLCKGPSVERWVNYRS